MFSQKIRSSLFIVGSLLLSVRGLMAGHLGSATVIGCLLILLSYFAARYLILYRIGVVISLFALIAMLTKPSRLFIRSGDLDQILLVGGVGLWIAGFLLFFLNPFFSGRWAE